MSDVDKLVIRINEKIKNLVQERQKLLTENTNLINKQKEILQEIENRNKLIETLQNKNRNVSIADSVKQLEGSSDVKRKIDEMVREIDKCIELLNK